MASVLLWLAVVGLWLLGLLGIVVPVLPGIGLVFAGILLYAVATGFAQISVTTVVVFGVIALLAWLTTFYAGAIGAKVSGGGRYAAGGTLVGAIGGLLLVGPPGLLAGAFLGALAGATYEGRSPGQASRIAVLSLAGTLSAALIQLLLAVSMIIAFGLALVL